MTRMILAAYLVVFWGYAAIAQQVVYLDDLDLSKVQQGWSNATARKNLRNKPITLGGKVYERGFCTHAPSEAIILLDGKASLFEAVVGVEDINASLDGVRPIVARVEADGRPIYTSDTLIAGKRQAKVSIPLKGVKLLGLFIDGIEGYSHTHTSWADARIVYTGTKPEIINYPDDSKPVILTPAPGPKPRLTGPKIFGVRPGSPIVHRFTATGQQPVTFSASPLPAGVILDPSTGKLSGRVSAKGTYHMTVSATNAVGTVSRAFRLKVGDTIGLTPAMGWNSWNVWGMQLDEAKVRAAADAMVTSGLAQHGWTYVNLDDGWEAPDRNPVTGILGVDATRFTNIPALAGYVHDNGLKIGLYSSPGVKTCGGRLGSLLHEELDAKTWASWGFDYLKYDRCGYKSAVPVQPTTRYWEQLPYIIMGKALKGSGRDIIFSLCQYGMLDVWEWGGSVGGNSWRTTDDIIDTWASMRNIGFHQQKTMPYTSPGTFNDLDMLVLGKLGWGGGLRPSRLTPNEQYTHMTLWCLLSSPLLLGCDLGQLDDFTLSLLTNDEVLEVNQDPAARPTVIVRQDEFHAVYAKPMEDGSVAVGVFNLSNAPFTYSISRSDLDKILGKGARFQQVRDLWRQQDLKPNTKISGTIGRHGCLLYRFK